MTIKCLVPDLPAPGELAPYLDEIHSNRWYTNFGPLNSQFEAEVSKLMGEGVYVSTFSSASAALELLLRASGLRQGAKVLVPSLTFPATAMAVIRSGMEPVLCDVDPALYQLTPDIAMACVGVEDLDAVLPVATYGLPVEVEPWENFVSATGLPVFIDAAAAFPAQQISQRVPAVVSLHATKPMGVGEGGLLLSRNEELVTRARKLSNHGFENSLVAEGGTNAKLSEYHAAVGLAQLRRADHIKSTRERVWNTYRELMASLAPSVIVHGTSGKIVPAQFVVEIENGAFAIIAVCSERGIETRRWYLPALHEQPLFQRTRRIGTQGDNKLPVVECLSQRVLGLPFHAFLSFEEIETVVQAVQVGVQAETC